MVAIEVVAIGVVAIGVVAIEVAKKVRMMALVRGTVAENVGFSGTAVAFNNIIKSVAKCNDDSKLGMMESTDLRSPNTPIKSTSVE